jgi:GGDEF domain-containing protein
VERRAAEICPENRLGLSIGAASYPLDGLDAEGLLAEADRRMYKTKRDHRLLASDAFQSSLSVQLPTLIQ